MRQAALFVAVALSATLLGSIPAHARGQFIDDDGHPFEEDIERLAASGITSGCDVDRFCPDRSVTRGQLAAFLRRALDGDRTLRFEPQDFTDIDDSEFVDDIRWISAAGITKGCTETRFCPNERVTREQMAAFLVRALQLRETDGTDFVDDDGSVFEGDIERLAAAGITKGCGDERFCPRQAVTRGQLAAFLVRAGFGGELPDGFYAGGGEYDAARITGVRYGLSGMFVSRKNPGIHWFVLDHTGLSSGDYTLFAIDAQRQRLVWKGHFDRSGANGAIKSWADVEDLTGVARDGRWYLAIWDNGTDSVYEIAEPSIEAGQSIESRRDLRPDRIIRPDGGIVGSGNIEGMAWSRDEDAMYWVGPRGSGGDLNDDPKEVMRVSSWTSAGGNPHARSIGSVTARPDGTNVPNAVGAIDISEDGRVMVIAGVGTNGSRENAYAMVHRRSSAESWSSYFQRVDRPSLSQSIRTGSPSENVALHPNRDRVYTAGEGKPGSAWGAVFAYELP